MWLTFVLAVVAGIVMLYVPGYFFSRTFSIGRLASAILAPPFTTFVAVLLGVVLQKTGVHCSGPALFMLTSATCLCLAGASALFCRRLLHQDTAPLLSFENDVKEVKHLCWYFAVAAFVTFIIFVAALDGPNAFSHHDDSTVHLSAVRAFVQTGTFSTLHVSSYLDQGVPGSYYPAGWHVMAAQIASLFGGDPVVATNALTIVFLVFVFPSALFLLLSTLFPDLPRVRACGALFSLAFSGFPWGFLVWGQLLSNLAAYVFVPLVLVLVIEAFRSKMARDRLRLAVAAFVGLLAVALAQPNGAFTLGIWVVVFVLFFLVCPTDMGEGRIDARRIVASITFLAFAWLMWVVAYRSPFLEKVVATNWGTLGSLAKETIMALLFKFGPREGIHPFLSVIVLLGVFRTLKNRQCLWLTVAYAFALFLVILDMGTNGPLKSFLTGFWYTDYYRTGAMATLFALPIAAYGFEWAVSLCESWYGRRVSREGEAEAQNLSLSWIVTGALVVVMAFCELAPFSLTFLGHTYRPGLRRIHSTLEEFYSWDYKLSGEEDHFVRKALQQIPDGALIVNVPRDGSCICYAVEGANVFFRRTSTTGHGNAEASEVVRTRLCDYAQDEEVRKLVEELGIKYVLRLDCEPSENPTTIKLRYKPEDWCGIETIDENTAGFTLVLSEGDMRLYAVGTA